MTDPANTDKAQRRFEGVMRPLCPWDDETRPEPQNYWGDVPLPRKLWNRVNRISRRLWITLFGTYRKPYWLPPGRIRTLDLAAPAGEPLPHLNDDDVAVHLHAYFIDLVPELLARLEHMPVPFHLYVTTDTVQKRNAIAAGAELLENAQSVDIRLTPNRGRDIGPWLVEMARFNNRHRFWLHIHTKKSLHMPYLGMRWREFLLDCTLGATASVQRILGTFESNPETGLLIPPFNTDAVGFNQVGWDNRQRARDLFHRLGIQRPPPRQPIFPAGSMFWYRAAALQRLFDAGFTYDDFEPEQGQLELTLMHLVERSVAYVAESAGFETQVVLPNPNEQA